MPQLWQSLLANLATSAIALIFWNFIGHYTRDWRPRHQSVILGVLMGASIVASMTRAIEISPGTIADLRAPLLANVGFFGGPLAATIAAIAALVCRGAIGGAGLLPGCFGIMLAASIGTAGHYICRGRTTRYGDLAALASAVAFGNLVVFLLLPKAALGVLLDGAAVPILILSFVATLLIALELYNEQQRRELIKRNDLYRAMVEALPDCLNIKEPDGRFIVANEATAELMAAGSADELIGKTDADFYPAAVAAHFRDDETALLADGKAVTLDQHFTKRDGTIGWLSTLKAPLRDKNGTILGIITHNRNITESRRLQTDLATAKEQLELALTYMTEGLAMFDLEDRIVFCNRQFQEMFPKTADLRVPGTKFIDIIRAAALRGEEVVAATDIESWAVARAALLHVHENRQFETVDGRWFEARSRAVGDGGTLSTVADITASKKLEQSFERQAMHDALTGLPNRAMFNAHLSEAHRQAQTTGNEVAVMLIDLDRFKEVNDTFGHAVGDALLGEVASRASAAMREGDLVARLGGDEFAVIMIGASIARAADSLAARILASLARPFKVENIELLPGASIGFAIFPGDDGGPDDLMIKADRALYAAKAAGRGKRMSYRDYLALEARRKSG